MKKKKCLKIFSLPLYRAIFFVGCGLFFVFVFGVVVRYKYPEKLPLFFQRISIYSDQGVSFFSDDVDVSARMFGDGILSLLAEKDFDNLSLVSSSGGVVFFPSPVFDSGYLVPVHEIPSFLSSTVFDGVKVLENGKEDVMFSGTTYYDSYVRDVDYRDAGEVRTIENISFSRGNMFFDFSLFSGDNIVEYYYAGGEGGSDRRSLYLILQQQDSSFVLRAVVHAQGER